MKKFVFSLQSVLNLREQEEKSARTELGKKTAECERIRGKMKAHIALLDRFEVPENGAVDWSAYQQISDFIRVQNLRLKDDLSCAEERRQNALRCGAIIAGCGNNHAFFSLECSLCSPGRRVIRAWRA